MGVLAPDGQGEDLGTLTRILPGTGRIPGIPAGFDEEMAWTGATEAFVAGLGALLVAPGAGLPLTSDMRRVLIFWAIAFSALVIFGVEGTRGKAGKSAAVGGGIGRSRVLGANESELPSDSR